MKLPFREHHLLNLLNAFEKQQMPLDLFISIYFRENSALGSKDRAEISEAVYSMIRWKGLIDYFAPKPLSWANRYSLFKEFNPKDHLLSQEIPIHVRCSFPQELFGLIQKSHGAELAQKICLASNTPAPTTIRVNSLKTTRESLLSQWRKLYDVSPCPHSPWGIIFHRKIHFYSMPEFKEGLFEIQDEGSQLVAQMIGALPGQHVLDFCSGSGGKTLAFAPAMENKGQIYLHDVRPRILAEAKKRLKRAGIQNAQILTPSSTNLKKLKKKMDWVLVDAPCTGTGTLRRNPDMKWRFQHETLQRLVGQQRVIFEKALSFLHPQGCIIYATCSILQEENQEQIEHFGKVHGLKVRGTPFQSIPAVGQMDGFYAAALQSF